jgi:hypothetical protein
LSIIKIIGCPDLLDLLSTDLFFSEVIEIIGRLCQRAHPKRDLKFGLYQLGVLPVADIYTNG